MKYWRAPLRPRLIFVFGITSVFFLSACNNSDPPIQPVQPVQTSELRPEKELTPGCYDWPIPDLTLPEAVGYSLPFNGGDPAIDFTLEDTTGEEFSLSELLETRPVLMVFGAFT